MPKASTPEKEKERKDKISKKLNELYATGKKDKKIGQHHSPKTEFKKGTCVSPSTQFKKGNTINCGENNPMYGKTRELNPNWNGGLGDVHKVIRRLFEYRQWRSDVFTRDDFTCQECGKRGVKLVSHHIKSFAEILKEYNIVTYEQALDCDELWNINNGTTLCKECHKKTDNYGGKKHK